MSHTNKKYIFPSERKLLHELILALHGMTIEQIYSNLPELGLYLTELRKEETVSEEEMGNTRKLLEALRDYREITHTDQDILEAPFPDVRREASEVTETFQQVASSVREYVRKEAGTKPVLQLIYDVYSRPDVQKVCGSNIWLMNRQIEIALSGYIQEHMKEAYEFVTIKQPTLEDF